MTQVDADLGPRLEPECRRAGLRADLEQPGDREDLAPPRLATRDAVELAQLLERVDPHVRVGADAEPDAPMEEPLDRQEAVAEVRLGRGTRAHPRARSCEQVELVPVGVRRVHDGGAGS
jgi:hypothetical protein